MDHSDLLTRENDLLADLLAEADLEAPVPTCPGWSLAQLVKHVGRGHRWAAQIIRERATEARDPRQVPDGRPPDDRPGAIAWLRAGAALVREDAEAAPEAEVWTFTGPKPASWWVRRRLHEATVHRADVALASGTTYEIAPEVAADGVSELLERLIVTAPTDPSPLEPGVGLSIESTDIVRSWLVHGTGSGLDLAPAPGSADAALVGSAAEVLLALTRRRDLSAPLEIRGDRAVVEAWLARTPF